ncbi:MAG: hypothetical protein IPG80_05265 [Anaerolineales bacterium]|uniref:cohesin domain-containing protein n=1 Tax=Candidatus Villigracilis vicinus TaxID=3140679 RepID=UPI0031358AA4|nr:hypothetical protein [Anaerolineales bacterium]MBK9778788.1 hypothetical protein [Anaerolineales bacterium]
MKKIALTFLALICFFIAAPVKAQSAESIWITASTNSFKTGETLIVTVNGASASPIQGLTFQIKFDPACLQPVNAASPISGMNGLSLPQITGLVDASFASTTPQVANGVLAEVRFITLGACQTNVTLESAALVIKNESGFAAPLPGVALGEKTIALAVSAEKGSSQDAPLLGTPLPLGTEPDPAASSPVSTGTTVMFAVIGILLLAGIVILIRILRGENTRG